jgi:hypothetical protein
VRKLTKASIFIAEDARSGKSRVSEKEDVSIVVAGILFY